MSADSKKSKYLHIIISPKEFQDPSVLHCYLEKWCSNYIISKELGENGHEHIDAFCEYKKEVRRDYQKKKILSLYPEVPKEEHINIRVVSNTIDTDPRYGYGYSLKEDNVLYTTFSEDEHREFLDYYNSQKNKVKESYEKLKSEKKELFKTPTIKSFGILLKDFLDDYFRDHKVTPGDADIEHITNQFLRMKVKDNTVEFDLFSKINVEKLVNFAQLYLGTVLLTVPKPIPIVNNTSGVHSMTLDKDDFC